MNEGEIEHAALDFHYAAIRCPGDSFPCTLLERGHPHVIESKE